MKRLKQNLLLGLCLSLFGCNPLGTEKFKVEFKNPSAFKDLKTNVTNVSVVNNQLVISGSALSEIKTATLKNGSNEEVFQVESASDAQLIANSARAVSIIAGSIFDLILSDAYGAATYQVTFSVSDGAITTAKISDGAVTSAKLDSMGASAGQYLKYNGVNWVASSLIDGQNYLGAWNVATNTPDLTMPSASAGDYYVVSNAGTFDGVAYGVGDWIISDGYNWQKLPYSKTSVSSFQGRKGIVTLQPSDYVSLKDGVTGKITGSSLNDLANIDLTTIAPVAGNVLKYDGAKWIAGADNTGIAAGSIVDADISGTADIAQSKISGLSASLTAKQNTSTLAADVRAIPLTGLTSTAGAVAATDSILDAFGKLMNAQSDYVSKSSGATITTGTIAVGGTGMITIPTATGTTLTEAANVTYVSNAIAANGVWAKDGTTINYTAGNVGIGITSPIAPLHVQSSSTIPAGLASIRLQGDYNTERIEGVSNAGFYIQGQRARGTVSNPLVVQNGDSIMGLTARGYDGTSFPMTSNSAAGIEAIATETYSSSGHGSAWRFTTTKNATTTAVERMRIDQSGNVGIGTTSPLRKLSVLADPGSSVPFLIATNDYSEVGGTGSTLHVDFGSSSGNTYTALYALSAGAWAWNNLVLQSGGGNVGIGTTAPRVALELGGDGAFLASGTTGAGWVEPNLGAGARMMWYPRKAAFRVGKVDGVQWNEANIGLESIGMGVNTTAAGNYSVALGNTSNSSGNQSFAVGTVALSSGDNSVAIASNRVTASGNSAVAIGSFLTSGGSNSFVLGKGVDVANYLVNNTTNSLAIGFNSTIPTFYVGPSSGVGTTGNVGIGTTTPSAKLDVSGSVAYTANATNFPGIHAAIPGLVGSVGIYSKNTTNTDVTGSTKMDAAIAGVATSNSGIGIYGEGAGGGMGVFGRGVGSGAIGIIGVTDSGSAGLASLFVSSVAGASSEKVLQTHAAPTSDVMILEASGSSASTFNLLNVLNSSGSQFVIRGNGSVGIGVAAPSEKLEINGNVKATAFLYSSDYRLKKNIEPIDNALEKINQLSGYFYEWKSNSKRDVGVIAQEVEKVFPDLVATDFKGMKSVKYGNFIAPIIEAIKEFYALFTKDAEEKDRKIASIEKKLADKDEEIADLKAKNAEMEMAICEINPDSRICNGE